MIRAGALLQDIALIVVYVVALNDTNVNSYSKAYNYKHRMGDALRTTALSTMERVYSKGLPKGASVIKEVRQYQRHRFSEEETVRMIADYTENKLTVYQLADKYTCHRETVSKLLKSNGVNVTARLMDEKKTREAIRLYESGLTLKETGERLGASADTVRSALIKADVAIRPPHRYARQAMPLG